MDFPTAERSERWPWSNFFLLATAVSGYFILGITAYLFGRALFPPSWSCDVPACFDRPDPLDPAMLLILVPGLMVGLIGLLQLRLVGRCPSPRNRRILRASFWLNALASMGVCLVASLARARDAGIVGEGILVATATCLLAGFALSLVNIGWSLLRAR